MEPTVKRRRLAPKIEQPSGPSLQHHEQISQMQRGGSMQQPLLSPYSFATHHHPQPPQAQPHQPDGQQQRNHDPLLREHPTFDSFIRQASSAAKLIYSRNNRSRYKDVSVLLLRWENDDSGTDRELENIFRERFNFRTENFTIPNSNNAHVKLTGRLAQFLEHDQPNHLLILYYAGYGFVGPDRQHYWACHAGENSAKLKWESVRSLIEDAQSDVLLLLDSCTPDGAKMDGSKGIKQGLSAYNWDPNVPEPMTGDRSFTSALTRELYKLSSGNPFTVQALYEEVMITLNQNRTGFGPLVNGTSTPILGVQMLPISFNCTPGFPQSIILSPLVPNGLASSQITSPHSPNGQGHRSSHEEQFYPDTPSASFAFEGLRALITVAFKDDPKQDITAFRNCLSANVAAASKMTVEGVFLGNNTLVMLSVPVALWSMLSSDPACTFLGYVKSRNLLNEYHSLQDTVGIARATAKELEDGKILLEAAEAAAASPVVSSHARRTSGPKMNYPPPIGLDRPDPVEDSVEMHEAALQLKALGHVRHISQDQNGNGKNRSHLSSGGSNGLRRSRGEESGTSHSPGDSGPEETLYVSEQNATTTKSKPRRSVQKQGPKQDTRCQHCTHVPFKDSSSLRKHIAAAHTRPFPCAFSFAGCTSTFGSKNEWKRHIASQHLCLTFYRCSECPASTAEGKGNEFNRKDLFTQHLRRMHAPFAIKKALTKGDGKLQQEWEAHVKEMQQSCLVNRRSPPQRSACPKPDCSHNFEGAGSWDEWTEHVGRHLEKGEATRLGVDKNLAAWAIDEGIIERKEDGEFRLCGADRDSGGVQEFRDGGAADFTRGGIGVALDYGIYPPPEAYPSLKKEEDTERIGYDPNDDLRVGSVS